MTHSNKFIPRFFIFIVVTFVWGIGLFNAKAAFASFGDCNNSSYLAGFDPRFASEPGFLCVESDRLPVTSEAGTTQIRIVQHLVADWATRPGAMRAIKDGVANAVRAMGTLGGFRISDVTILLVDGFAPGSTSENFGEIAAWTNASAGDECKITVWLLGTGATASYGSSMIAHELFHCIQRSSLNAAQLGTTAGLGVAGGGTWWFEGSADWFSSVAVPPPSYMQSRVQAFDANSGTTALNAMSYDAYVFFAWLGGSHGPNSVLPFLRQMASSANEGAQQMAMGNALPADGWLKFAEDYIDRQIHDGQGASIGSNPTEGDRWEWRTTRSQQIQLPPFVLKRGHLSFQCGHWALQANPTSSHAVRVESGGAWGAVPATLDATSSGGANFRFAGMNATETNIPLQVNGRLTSGCGECAGSREVDQCLEGTWQMSVDGMMQWMQEHIHQAHVTGVSQEGNTLTLNPDGTFATGASHVTGTVEGRDNTQGRGVLQSSATGRWSTSAGQLNLCPDSSTMAGTITVNKSGHSTTIPYPARAMPPSSRAYSCSGNSFTLTTPMGTAGNVVSTYSKTAGPAPEGH